MLTFFFFLNKQGLENIPTYESESPAWVAAYGIDFTSYVLEIDLYDGYISNLSQSCFIFFKTH